MGGIIPEEAGLRIALKIIQEGLEFSIGDAGEDMRTIEIEAAIIRKMKELGIAIEIPIYCEGLV